MKTFVTCTGTEKLLGKDGVAIFQSKDAAVVLTVVVKGETKNLFKKGHEYELMLTE